MWWKNLLKWVRNFDKSICSLICTKFGLTIFFFLMIALQKRITRKQSLCVKLCLFFYYWFTLTYSELRMEFNTINQKLSCAWDICRFREQFRFIKLSCDKIIESQIITESLQFAKVVIVKIAVQLILESFISWRFLVLQYYNSLCFKNN